jgi:hypothetical protein
MKKALSIKLLSPTKEELKYLGEITSLNSIETSGTKFDPNGLYSIEFFGVSGSKERMIKFAYIKTIVDVIHPKIYKAIMSLDNKFEKIITNKLKVKLDKKTGTFIEDEDGETGYTFFLDSIKYLKFERNDSKQRDSKIDLIYKTVKDNKLIYNNLFVLPAGMRDYEITDDGRPSEDEINDLYRTVIRDKDLITGLNTDGDLSLIDPIRIKLQDDVNAIYDYIKSLIDGKHKFIRGKWIKSGVTGGTRNVFSGIPTNIKHIDDPDVIKPYEVVLGCLQTAKTFGPLAHFHIKKTFLENVIDYENEEMVLFDENLKPKKTKIKTTDYEKWTTKDGLESIIYRCIDDNVKNSPIVINGKYLYLIYDNGKEIKLVSGNDIDFIEDSNNLRPITYGEFLFFSVKDVVKKYPGTTTRHPVIENGSTYYAFVKLRTTTEDREVKDLSTGEIYRNYPIIGRAWVNTIGLHYSRLEGMGADFDGDTGPFIGYQTIDAAEEAREVVSKSDYYIGSDGKPLLDIIDDVLTKTIKTLTKK